MNCKNQTFITSDENGNFVLKYKPIKTNTNNPQRSTTLQSADRCIIPMLSVQPHRICLYNQYVGFPSNNRFDLKAFDDNLQKGKVSQHAEKKIKKYVNWLVFLAKRKRVFIEELNQYVNFKINFVTLTLPSKQVHSDLEIKEKILNQFLVELRQRWKCKLYLWKAESQQNGNIHFHITCDKYIYFADLRNVWNRICDKLGYVSRYSDEMKKLDLTAYLKQYSKSGKKKDLIKRYWDGVHCGWSNPNSTDIHSVRNIRNMPAYLSKYFTNNEKQEGRRKIEGNLWYCSELLSKFNALQIENVCSVYDEMSELWEKFKSKIFSKDFVQLIKIPIWAIKKHFKNSKIYDQFSNYVYSVLSENQLTFENL